MTNFAFFAILCRGRGRAFGAKSNVSHRLADERIDEAVFVAFYVGRSDSDVRARLHAWVGVDGGPDRYRPSAKAAHDDRQRAE